MPLERIVHIYEANADTVAGDLANALAGLALILERRGKTPEAIAAWEQTRDLYAACQFKEGVEAADRKLRLLQL